MEFDPTSEQRHQLFDQNSEIDPTLGPKEENDALLLESESSFQKPHLQSQTLDGVFGDAESLGRLYPVLVMLFEIVFFSDAQGPKSVVRGLPDEGYGSRNDLA
jgi:hypothetical protein